MSEEQTDRPKEPKIKTWAFVAGSFGALVGSILGTSLSWIQWLESKETARKRRPISLLVLTHDAYVKSLQRSIEAAEGRSDIDTALLEAELTSSEVKFRDDIQRLYEEALHGEYDVYLGWDYSAWGSPNWSYATPSDGPSEER